MGADGSTGFRARGHVTGVASRAGMIEEGVARGPLARRRANRGYTSPAIDGGQNTPPLIILPGRGHQIHRLVARYAQRQQGVDRRIALDADDRGKVRSGAIMDR